MVEIILWDAPRRGEALLKWLWEVSSNSQKSEPSESESATSDGEEESHEEARGEGEGRSKISKPELTRIRPTRYAYASAMDCWSRSVEIDAPERALALLREMSMLHKQGHKGMRPDAVVYGAVMNA